MAATKIASLFETNIRRPIEEVVKVQQAEVGVVREEITEYVPTQAIQIAYETVFHRMIEALTDPTEAIGIWISGFFGSGKSSFAKILGYVLDNRTLGSERAADLLKARFPENRRLRDLIDLVNQRIPTKAVIFDISESLFVRTQNEPVREVMYRAFLHTLGYSDDIDVAELEISLEGRGKLDDFSRRFQNKFGRPWTDSRKDRSFALSEASAVLHDMDPTTHSSPDSWFRGRKPVNLETEEFAERCFDLLDRRAEGRALVFVIDEVGQYVSRSVEKMLDLQGVVQAFARIGHNRAKARKGHPAWIVVTAQEKLDEVVDALGTRKTELARLQARFATPIDLVPADISEVASRRVLRKKPEGEKKLKALYEGNKGRIQTLLRWTRTSRQSDVEEDAFVRLYPFPPHFVELSIDVVTGIRLQPGAMRHIGGSNRTIIKQAQQVLIHPEVNLADRPVGDLVTLDMLFDLLRPSIPSERWRDVQEIENRIVPKAKLAAKVAKAITLLEFVRDLPRTPENITAVLWPRVDAEPVLPDVERALAALEEHQFVRFDTEGGGYKLQSAQEKSWAKERESIDLKGKPRREILREKLRDAFGEPNLRMYRLRNLRTFKVGFQWDGDRVGDDGEIGVTIITAEPGTLDDKLRRARAESGESEGKNTLFWVIPLDDRIEGLLRELYRSREMIARREQAQARGLLPEEEVPLLNEERVSRDRRETALKNAIAAAARTGKGYFRGVECEIASLGETLGEACQLYLGRCVPELFPKFEMAARQVSGKEAIEILQASNLSGLSALFHEGRDGLGLVRREGEKWVVNATAETSKEVVEYLRERHAYGDRVDGKSLEKRFTGLGYGWDVDLLKAVAAALLRAGAIEIIASGRRIRRHDDLGLREVFGKVPAWRSASFAPRETLDLRMLAAAARNLEVITGEEAEIDEEGIARRAQALAKSEQERLTPTLATVQALGLPGQILLSDLDAELRGLIGAPPDDCVRSLAEAGRSLAESLRRARTISGVVLGDGLATLRAAKRIAGETGSDLRRRVESGGKIAEAIQRLQESLSTETFAERLPQIAEDVRTATEGYRKAYIDLHKTRSSAYAKAVEEVKGSRSWGLLDARIADDAERGGLSKEKARAAADDAGRSLLAPILERACTGGLPEAEDWVCPECRSALSMIEQDLGLVEALAGQVMRQVLDRAEPPTEVERVRVIEFFPSTALESEQAVDEALGRLRDHLLRLVREGRRFRLE